MTSLGRVFSLDEPRKGRSSLFISPDKLISGHAKKMAFIFLDAGLLALNESSDTVVT